MYIENLARYEMIKSNYLLRLVIKNIGFANYKIVFYTHFSEKNTVQNGKKTFF